MGHQRSQAMMAATRLSRCSRSDDLCCRFTSELRAAYFCGAPSWSGTLSFGKRMGEARSRHSFVGSACVNKSKASSPWLS